MCFSFCHSTLCRYVAVDERLILAIEQLVTRHRSGHPHQDHTRNSHGSHSGTHTGHAASAATAAPAKEGFHLMPKAATNALTKATATPFALRAQLGDQLGKLGHHLWTNLTQHVYHDAARLVITFPACGSISMHASQYYAHLYHCHSTVTAIVLLLSLLIFVIHSSFVGTSICASRVMRRS